MSFALNFEGVNDYCTTNSTIAIPASTPFVIEYLFSFTDDFGRPFGSTLGANNSSRTLHFFSTDTIRLTDSSGMDADFLASYTKTNYNKFRWVRNGSSVLELFLNDVSIGTQAGFTGSINIDLLGRSTGATSYTSESSLQYLLIDVNAIPLINLDATSSNHGSGTPLLVDIVGTNDATGVNMPTDGSAWLNLGGSISIPVIMNQLRTQRIS